MTKKIKLKLVPVGVFGAEDGYGLNDVVSWWGDCNRAYGKIYRVEDIKDARRVDGETVEVWVDKKDLPFFDKIFDDGNKPDKQTERAKILSEIEKWITAKDWRVLCCNKDYPSIWWQTSFGQTINAIIGKNIGELMEKLQEMGEKK